MLELISVAKSSYSILQYGYRSHVECMTAYSIVLWYKPVTQYLPTERFSDTPLMGGYHLGIV